MIVAPREADAKPLAIAVPKTAKLNVVALVAETKAAESKIKGEAAAMHANSAAENLNAPKCSSWTSK